MTIDIVQTSCQSLSIFNFSLDVIREDVESSSAMLSSIHCMSFPSPLVVDDSWYGNSFSLSLSLSLPSSHLVGVTNSKHAVLSTLAAAGLTRHNIRFSSITVGSSWSDERWEYNWNYHYLTINWWIRDLFRLNLATFLSLLSSCQTK